MYETENYGLPLQRTRRYLFVANKTCGHIPFCTKDIHDAEESYPYALLYHRDCSGFFIIASILLDILLCLLITTVNVLIILTIKKSKSLHNRHGAFKVSLAMYDLLIGLVVIPGCAFNKIRLLLVPLDRSYIRVLFSLDDSAANKVFGFALTMSLAGSLMVMLLLSFDRFLAVTRPLTYRNVGGKKRSYLSVAAVSCVVIFLSIVPFGDPGNFHYTVDYMTMAFTLEIRFNQLTGNIYHGLFFLVIVFVIPYISVVIVTCATWVMIIRDNSRSAIVTLRQPTWTRQQDGNIQDTSGDQSRLGSVGNDSTPYGVDNMRPLGGRLHNAFRKCLPKNIDDDMRRVTGTVSIIVLTFSAFVLPFIIVQAENLSRSPKESEEMQNYDSSTTPPCHPVLYMLFLYLMFSNSFCNFIIYNLRNSTFRKELLRLLPVLNRAFRDLQQRSPCSVATYTNRPSSGSLEIQSVATISRRTSLFYPPAAFPLETVAESCEIGKES